MIAIDELKATARRLELLHNNTESAEEKIISNVLMGNLLELAKQAEMLSKSPQFQSQVEMQKNANKDNQ